MRIISAIAALSLLTACGGNKDESEDAPDSAATAGASETAEGAAEGGAAVEGAGDQAAASGAAPAAFAQCAACHAVVPNKNGIGPSLAGVYGAKAGHVSDYAYSPAMQNSGLTWDDATLNAYLDNPQAKVPGTKMTYAGLKDEAKRKEVIDYLKTL